MSIAVVVRKGNRVCIGADTLTKSGYTKESAKYVANHSKLVAHGNSYVATVGYSSWALIWKEYLAKQKRRDLFRTVESIFALMNKMHATLKEHYYLNPHERKDDEFESSQLVAAIASPFGIFAIHSLRSVEEYRRFYAIGSGYKFAMGAMHAVYDKLDSPEKIATAGLEAAVEFDDGCGEPLELHTVKLRARKKR